MGFEHVPVLLEKVLASMSLKKEALIVDGTLGLGGYSETFLRHSPDWRVVGIDRDERAREIAGKRLAPFGDRFQMLAGDFRNMKSLCAAANITTVDCVVLDLGVSNMQLVDGERGFSFREDGPLDMRMDPGSERQTAADLVNTLSRESLTDIFRRYGEEKFAWTIAGEILKRRNKKKIVTTFELVDVIRCGIPSPVMRKMNGHPARKVFQALRIAVNDELGALEQGLQAGFDILGEQGRLIVVTYHSLEDRIVKHQFKAWHDMGEGILDPRKSLVPDEAEVEQNPKSRSARLRGFLKRKTENSEGRMGPWRRF